MWRFLTIAILLLGCSGGCTDTPKDLEPVEESPIYWNECGFEVGDHACDFTLTDQNGVEWNLYDHYGEIIVLDFSTEWCGYCHLAAEETQSVQNEKEELVDFSYVTIIVEDMAGNSPPTQQALQRWSEHYFITAPVLAGSRDMLESGGGDWPISSWPTFYILNDDLLITQIIHGYSAQSLEDAINSTINPS
jgi:thiol-disulfide isomerase/thioredoxin|tara:strand:- start:1580 stop:2152 length:573 start_codon:yes stop_codon:yes gene_type:complete